MKITAIHYNWFFTPDGDGYDTARVGQNGVVSIEERTQYHPRACYDIRYADGKIQRVFNPNKVEMEVIK